MNDVLEDFFGSGNDIKPAAVDHTLQALLDSWLATITAGGIGFLPRSWQSRTFWYAFAPSTRHRRELLSLLDAWVGPTYSDLAVRRGDLESTDPFDAALATSGVPPIRFEVLPRTPPASTKAKETVRNALTTLTRLANGRPPSQFDAPRTTVEILDDLGHAIAARDAALAGACMVELEHAADLDESNLAFLRIRVHAGTRNWAAIFADPALEHVLAMRRPLAVTRAIQLAVYSEYLREFDLPGSEPDLKLESERLAPGLRDIYTGAPPRSRPEAVVELVCRMLATSSPDDSAIRELLETASRLQGGLDLHLRRIVEAFYPGGGKEEPGAPTPSAAQPVSTQIAELMFQGQFAACIELGLTSEPSVETGRALVYSARQLSSADWAARVMGYLSAHGLRTQVAATSPVFEADLQWLTSVTSDAPASGWRDWFDMLSRPDSSRPQLAADALQIWEPLPLGEFVSLLETASDDTLGRLGENGGQFLAAHSELLDSSEASAVTLRLVAAIALGGKASTGIRTQALALAESFATAGPNRPAFEEFLEWASFILEANAAATTVSWVCDVLGTLTSIPVPGGGAAALNFYYRATDCLRAFRSALDAADMEALRIVGAELKTVIPWDSVPAESDDPVDAAASYRYLDGKMVVLHSLTESAITRASQILRALLPNLDVRTNSEHDGSPQLSQLSRNADVFVIVTASAKHAATNFIAAERGAKPIIKVNSRGSSAILRVLAGYKA